jgi:hypothetical protein
VSGPAGEAPVAMAEVLKQHIEICPQHSLAQLRAEYDEEVISHDIEEKGFKEQLKTLRAERAAAGEREQRLHEDCQNFEIQLEEARDIIDTYRAGHWTSFKDGSD